MFYKPGKVKCVCVFVCVCVCTAHVPNVKNLRTTLMEKMKFQGEIRE